MLLMPSAPEVDPTISGRWGADVNLCHYLLMRHLAEGRGDRPALHYEDRSFSYFEVAEQVRKVATVLEQNGVAPGDRVAIVLPDNPAYVATFFAALLLGAIAVPLNVQMPAGDLAEILDRVQARVLFLDEGKLPSLRGNLAKTVISCGDSYRRRAGLEALLDSVAQTERLPVKADGAAAYCLFSSGTTGRPKGIIHRHPDILHCIEAYCIPTLGMTEADRVLAVPKLSFGYGLGGNLLAAFYVGGASILFEAPSSGSVILDAARKFAPTLFLAQPRALGQLLDLDCGSAFDRLRIAASAGEILVPTLYEKWLRSFKVELLDGFGTTEIGHIFISNQAGSVVPESAGRVLPPFEIKLLDASGEPVPEGEIGHLWVRGPSLSSGYLGEPERTAKAFVDGWVRTGDLASMRRGGTIFLAGRADEMIKSGCGEWVAPAELEGLILSHPAVSEAAVVGASDSSGVVTPKAFVVLNKRSSPSIELEDELKDLVAQRWPELRHKHLSSVEFVPSLPRTSTGKLQRFKLQPVTLTEFSYQC